MKKVLITYLSFIIIYLFLCLFYYNDYLLSSFKLLKLLSFLICITISSYYLENKKRKTKYISGMSISILFILLSVLLSLISNKITPSLFLYYGLILISSFLGTFIKNNKKKKA